MRPGQFSRVRYPPLTVPAPFNPVHREMTLNNLTDAETEVVFDGLRCVAAGDVILNNGEFRILFGITFDRLEDSVRRLPDIDESDQDVQLAINNALNNLLGYPHGRDARFLAHVVVPRQEVARIFWKWRGEQKER